MAGFARFKIAPASFGAAMFCSITLAACSSGDKTIDRSANADTAAMAASAAPTPMAAPMDSMAGMNHMNGTDKMAGMSNMTGDPDRDFLRMMSDHHKGLVAMAHMTREQKPAAGAAADAAKLDSKQDAELDKMQTMLEKSFKDQYTPKVTPDNQAMADQLRGKSGAEYDRTFYQNVVKHHQQAVTMVDDYLPKGRNATIKQMAEKMKADQKKEISEFQKKADSIK